jgi:hypothetical protein
MMIGVIPEICHFFGCIIVVETLQKCRRFFSPEEWSFFLLTYGNMESLTLFCLLCQYHDLDLYASDERF